MIFDEKSVSKTQKRVAQEFIDTVTEGFELENPPNYVIKGLNSNEEIAKLEYLKFEKNEKEIKKIEKRIKSLQNYTNSYVKVVFEFNKKLKKFICMSGGIQTSDGFSPRYTWTGVLDFPITSSILFGRVCKSPRHGGGKYYFAPCEKLKFEIADFLEQLEEETPELFPYKIIESNMFMELLGGSKFVKEVMDLLKQMPRIIKSSEETTPLVDALNQDKELINAMKKIPHFGTIETGYSKFASEIDVSTLFIPYKEVTYFHIDQYSYARKKHFRTINTLLQSLEELNN